MQFVNESTFPAAWTMGFEPDGRELLVVIVKATYTIPEPGMPAVLSTDQVPLTEADEFTGEPGLSACLHETDYSHRKPHCDVILNGSAYAPLGRPVDRVRVSLQVGSVLSKSFYVFGDRVWHGDMFSVYPSRPQPFISQPISYDRAFGGVDTDPDCPEKVETYRENPIGVGFRPISKRQALIGQPLPNTAEDSAPIDSVTGRYRPMSFGHIARNFYPRYTLAGTYSKQWLENWAPFWPDDFSYAFFQSTFPDQQIGYLNGDEQVVLENLTPQGFTHFNIPRQTMPVTVLYYRQDDRQLSGVCDTLIIEPDLRRFSLVWRLSLPMRRNCFEVRQVIVGERPYSWHSARRAQRAGKAYYRDLAEFIRAKRGSVSTDEELES